MKLCRHSLRVRNRGALEDFYCDLLGMRNFGPKSSPMLGYDSAQCLIAFRAGDFVPYRPAKNDFYWKIGITLRDLDTAVDYLRHKGYSVSDPRQFRDIGYLCHLTDPEGFTVELLQQGFEGHANSPGPGHPVGGQATLAHLSFRVADIETARVVCERDLGLRLMSVQHVDDLGFRLYFFSFSNETLPYPDHDVVANREWLWARPYTLLELQHLTASDATIHTPSSGEAGFEEFSCDLGGTGRLSHVSDRELLTRKA